MLHVFFSSLSSFLASNNDRPLRCSGNYFGTEPKTELGLFCWLNWWQEEEEEEPQHVL